MTLTHDVPHGSTWGNLGQPGATWGNLGQPMQQPDQLFHCEKNQRMDR
jgi:hypothetical protein